MKISNNNKQTERRKEMQIDNIDEERQMGNSINNKCNDNEYNNKK